MVLATVASCYPSAVHGGPAGRKGEGGRRGRLHPDAPSLQEDLKERKLETDGSVGILWRTVEYIR